jgi:hypothetical protein
MAYEKCAEVNEAIWLELKERDPAEVTGRTGVPFRDGVYHLPFLDRTLVVNPNSRQLEFAGKPGVEPGFRVCLTALLYLLHLDPSLLGPPLSPLELPGGATFFRGHHGLPNAALEERFGREVDSFQAAGKKLGAESRPAGDAALAVQVFPGLVVEVVLWRGDEEFPPQASFTLPAHLDRFWFLDAVWGLLNLVAQELIAAAAELS